MRIVLPSPITHNGIEYDQGEVSIAIAPIPGVDVSSLALRIVPARDNNGTWETQPAAALAISSLASLDVNIEGFIAAVEEDLLTLLAAKGY